MTATQRGFTLVELMIAVAVLAILGSAALALRVQAEQENRVHLGYQSDVRDCRRALRSIESDVRAARGVEVEDDRLVVLTAGDRVSYRIVNGELRRTAGDDDARVLARCIRDIEVHADDALVRVVLRLRRRAAVPSRSTACVATTVAMRNWEGLR